MQCCWMVLLQSPAKPQIGHINVASPDADLFKFPFEVAAEIGLDDVEGTTAFPTQLHALTLLHSNDHAAMNSSRL